MNKGISLLTVLPIFLAALPHNAWTGGIIDTREGGPVNMSLPLPYRIIDDARYDNWARTLAANKKIDRALAEASEARKVYCLALNDLLELASSQSAYSGGGQQELSRKYDQIRKSGGATNCR